MGGWGWCEWVMGLVQVGEVGVGVRGLVPVGGVLVWVGEGSENVSCQ